VGSWIKLTFASANINKLVIQHRVCSCEWNQLVRLEFSDGSSEKITLLNSGTANAYFLTKSYTTTFVNMVVETVYSTTNNGYAEVQLWTAADYSCVRPATLSGYSISTELSLVKSSFSVTAACATGYEGTAAATACTSSGGAYTLSGCAATVCTRPASSTGYTISAEVLPKLTFSVTATCATGYAGSISTVACVTSGPYSLSGCMAFSCTRPTVTTGYTIGAETLSRPTFAATVSCSSGYAGSASATGCSTASGAYSLSGCSPVICTRPTTVG